MRTIPMADADQHDMNAVLADAELSAAHAEGQAALADGDFLDAAGLAAAMRIAQRLPE